MRLKLLMLTSLAAAAGWAATAHAQQSFNQAETIGGVGQWQAPVPAQVGPPPQGQYGQPQPQGQFGQPQGQFGQQQPQVQFGQPQQQGQYGQPQPQGQYGQPQGQFGQQQPQGQFGQSQQQGQYGQPSPGAGQNPQLMQMLDQMAQFERQELGVPATNTLHSGPMHGATPASIPGGQVITTKGLIELVQGQRTPYMIFDVLGGNEMLPGAIPAVQASSPGQFDDQISQQMSQYLQQATRGNTQIPLIFYCASIECWMSYNASLRAIKLGYSNVLWYRGGIAAWKKAGGPTVPSGGGYPPPGRQ